MPSGFQSHLAIFIKAVLFGFELFIEVSGFRYFGDALAFSVFGVEFGEVGAGGSEGFGVGEFFPHAFDDLREQLGREVEAVTIEVLFRGGEFTKGTRCC